MARPALQLAGVAHAREAGHGRPRPPSPGGRPAAAGAPPPPPPAGGRAGGRWLRPPLPPLPACPSRRRRLVSPGQPRRAVGPPLLPPNERKKTEAGEERERGG